MRTERARLANLVALVVATCGIGLFLQGALFWVGAVVVVAAAAFGAFSLLLELDPRGVPIESLAAPGAATFATLALAHAAGPQLAAVLALAVGGAALAVTLYLESRLLGADEQLRARGQQQLIPLLVLVAFLAFAGAGLTGIAAVPLMLVDALIAFVLGYRLAALRAVGVRQAASSAGTYAAVVGVAAALVQTIALPALVGPAILAAVFYLWSAYRSASRAERRSSGWLAEYVALAAAAVMAIAWNVLVR